MNQLSLLLQVSLASRTDILIGVHGAVRTNLRLADAYCEISGCLLQGLVMCIYQRRGALVVQLNPTGLAYWEITLFHRMATLAGVTYYDWTERDATNAAGLGKDSISFRYPGTNGESEPLNVRTFVAETLLTWANSANRDYW
jgi:hypothetical protein